MAEVTIKALGEQARWSLRVSVAKIGELAGFRIALDINRAVQTGECLSARLGPDEWLLCAPPQTTLADGALGNEHHSLVDVSHRYAAFGVEGAQAHVLLAAGCPLDLHPSAFAAGTATRTLLGKAEIILWRLQEAPAYRVECARSFAPYVLGFLREAEREFA